MHRLDHTRCICIVAKLACFIASINWWLHNSFANGLMCRDICKIYKSRSIWFGSINQPVSVDGSPFKLPSNAYPNEGNARRKHLKKWKHSVKMQNNDDFEVKPEVFSILKHKNGKVPAATNWFIRFERSENSMGDFWHSAFAMPIKKLWRKAFSINIQPL